MCEQCGKDVAVISNPEKGWICFECATGRKFSQLSEYELLQLNLLVTAAQRLFTFNNGSYRVIGR